MHILYVGSDFIRRFQYFSSRRPTNLTMVRLLEIVRPFMNLLPDVSYPDRRIPFREKMLWTTVAMIVFLVCSQIPLYGIGRIVGSDPFYWMRAILASNRGSLMELGISPLVTSAMSLQFLTGTRLVHYDQNRREDRELYSGTQKIAALSLTLIQATGYILSGAYGPVTELGAYRSFFIVAQLVIGGIIVILLDDMLSKGYGIGNATNLFIITNTSASIVWSAMSPSSVVTARGSEFEGSILAFFQFLFTNPTKLPYAFFRTDASNLTSLLTTIVVGFVVLYLQGFRIEIPVKYQKVRSMQTSYPIKLFYTGNTPVVLLSALVANIFFVSQVLYGSLKSNFLVNLIGQWQAVSSDSRTAIPVGGLAYWISPPGSILHLFSDPFHVVFYVVFVLLGCTFFAKTWIDVTNSGSREVAKNLKEYNLTMRGYRDTTVVAVLDRYIPTTAALGGFAVGALTLLADALGCIGSGSGVVMAVAIVYQYFEIIAKEVSQYGM
jgi:protein transport protein SEC61 subunit alpha